MTNANSEPNRIKTIVGKLNEGSLGEIEDVKLKGVDNKVSNAIFTAVSIGVVLYTLYIGIFGAPNVMIHRISHLGIILFLTPLFYPSGIFKKDSIFEIILNKLFTLAGLGSSFYALLNWERFYRYSLSTTDIIVLTILILMVLECTRRAIGLPIVVIALISITYCLVGQYMPGALAHKGYSLVRVINMITVGTEGLFSSIIGIASLEIAAFLILSALLQSSGALKYFMKLAFSVAGTHAGGPAKVAVVSSAMMGTVSGSTVANVTATGSITIPLMKLMGFVPEFAGAVEAVASAGGSLTPPVLGATAFLIAEFLDVSYWQVAVAAAIPALLYYISLFNAVHIRSVKKGLLGLPKEDLPDLKQSLKDSLFLLLPIGVLVVLMAMKFTALYAAFWSIILLFIVTNIKKDTRTSLSKLVKTVRLTTRTLLPVSTACATAGIIVATLSMTGLGQKMGYVITSLAGGNLLIALVLTQIAALILGTGLVTPATYTLLAVLCAPALIKMGAAPVAAHMFIFHFAIIGTLTPPVSLAAFAAAGIAGSNPIRTGLYAFRLAIPGFLVPYFFVLNPALIGTGSIGSVIISLATACIGVVFMGMALEGFSKKELKIWERILAGVGGVLLVYPETITSIIGLVLALASLALMKLRADSNKKAAA